MRGRLLVVFADLGVKPCVGDRGFCGVTRNTFGACLVRRLPLPRGTGNGAHEGLLTQQACIFDTDRSICDKALSISKYPQQVLPVHVDPTSQRLRVLLSLLKGRASHLHAGATLGEVALVGSASTLLGVGQKSIGLCTGLRHEGLGLCARVRHERLCLGARLRPEGVGLSASLGEQPFCVVVRLLDRLVNRALGQHQHPLEGLVARVRLGRRLLRALRPLGSLLQPLNEGLDPEGRLLQELVDILGVVTATQLLTELHVAEGLRGHIHAVNRNSPCFMGREPLRVLKFATCPDSASTERSS